MNGSPIREVKEELRCEIRSRLRKLSPDLRAEASLVICQAAANLPAFAASRCVALFAPLPLEPDVHPLIEEAWAQGKRVALPLMIWHGAAPALDWHEVANWEDLAVQGPFGLREPEPLRCPRLKVADLDCVFVPGMAFDRQGYRLGRGGGFYDRFLDRVPASLPCIGIFFSAQKVASVPRETHDRRLRSVLTEDDLSVFEDPTVA